MDLCANPMLVNATSGILQIPAREDHLLVARLALSGVATIYGFDIDQVDDIKAAATEALHMMIRKLRPEMALRVRFEGGAEGLEIAVEGPEPMRAFEDDSQMDAVCLCILRDLVDEVTPTTHGMLLRKRKA